MSWERRLREMILAGGALASVACGASIESSAGDAGSQDATSQDASDDMPSVGQPCCNGNYDPCCTYEQCGAALTQACAQELACQDAGLWKWNGNMYVCVAPPPDAGRPDSDSAAPDASGDAPGDAPGDGG